MVVENGAYDWLISIDFGYCHTTFFSRLRSSASPIFTFTTCHLIIRLRSAAQDDQVRSLAAQRLVSMLTINGGAPNLLGVHQVRLIMVSMMITTGSVNLFMACIS